MISVQNACDSSRSRTFNTRWLIPTGVTASRGGVVISLLCVIGISFSHWTFDIDEDTRRSWRSQAEACVQATRQGYGWASLRPNYYPRPRQDATTCMNASSTRMRYHKSSTMTCQKWLHLS